MRHEFFDSIKSWGCVPLRQELLIICYGGTVWGHFMSFTGPPSRFSCSNCHSGTAIQTSGTVAGIYGIRRRQVKCCGRFVPLGAVLALDCCRVPGTWSSSIDKVHAVRQKPHFRGQRTSKSWPCPWNRPFSWMSSSWFMYADVVSDRRIYYICRVHPCNGRESTDNKLIYLKLWPW